MSSYQQSLAQLFKAEEEAGNIVRDAEDERQRILEKAHRQTEEEIQKKRIELESEYEQKIKDYVNNFDQLQEETEMKKKSNEEAFRKNKESVLNMLVERVLEVNLKLPKNVKGEFHKYYNH